MPYCYRFIVVIFFVLIHFGVANAQYEIPPKPNSTRDLTENYIVYDQIGLLKPSEKEQLRQKLVHYADSTSTQVVIAIINSTQGEYINYLGAQWAQKWGIGQEEKDNGVFILLAKNDRKIGINTGRGVEHLLTDAICKRIINSHITPYFKNQNYVGGLQEGVKIIFNVLSGEFKMTPKQKEEFPMATVLFLLVIILLIISIFKNRHNGGSGGGGFRGGGNDTFETIILSRSGRSRYRGSSGGSFGSGGFGGGSFGGGGASGGW